MVKMDAVYQGHLRCQATHGPSGAVLLTDAPVDNLGKGEAFSPTDLVATALATCMITTMGIAAQRNGIDLGNTTAATEKEMVATPTRRIGKITVRIHVPTQLDEEQKQKLKNAALACPVHKSLHPDVQIPVEFTWG